MPVHLSHLLQLLDVGVFAPLKRVYSDQVSGLVHMMATKINKPAFIQVYKTAYYKVFTKENICSAFRGAGLVLFDPEVVLLKLDVKLHTPTPPTPETTSWESKMPSNMRKLGAQLTLVSKQIRRHHNLSPTEMVIQLNSLVKGVSVMVHTAALICDKLFALQKATEAANLQKKSISRSTYRIRVYK